MRMGKTVSELHQLPQDDLELLMAGIVDEQRRITGLIEDMSRTGKLTPEAYALLMKDVL